MQGPFESAGGGGGGGGAGRADIIGDRFSISTNEGLDDFETDSSEGTSQNRLLMNLNI